MSDAPLHFANPGMANALWGLLAFLGLLVWLELRGAGALEGLVGRVLQDRLVARPAAWRPWLRLGLLGLAGLCMIVALMRPQYGLRYVATPRVGAEIMIALDVSKSMLADDAAPSRLERAKAEIVDLLGYLGEDHVGLIAFAGRASVLSPMTPDKSFLRLVLDSAGPHSVTRGGTRLEEPIRRAVAGFGPPGPAQRALILITDGEDHDSFPLDAAKAAAEAGVKIIAIGFGDEAGSEIHITDPVSGARTRLRDADGRAVISRLDGALLRELALATDGAYVPAGTGVLDLASIYEEHIARLTRSQLDERGRTIRDELYPWFVLFALISLVAAVAIAAGRPGKPAAGPAARAAAALLLIAVASASPARAQVDPAAAQAEAELLASPEGAAAGGDLDALDETPANQETNPRALYNRALEELEAGEADTAAALLRRARRDATDDLELRFRATYNLGSAAVATAEQVEETSPQEALTALYEATDWFRDATGQRPDDEAARHNLEVTLRRALVLADFIAKQGDGDLGSELDGLIASQRERARASATLLEQVVRAGELDATELLRPAFRSAATDQRTLLADADALADRAAEEKDAISAMGDEERTPQDQMRGAQLGGVLHYLDRARERMGQTRRQLRQRSAERAYRRASAALGELKRARDQLRGPVEQLEVLIGEVDAVARVSAALAAEGQLLPGAKQPVALPAFLNAESAGEENASVAERVGELGAGFEAGVERADQQAAAGTGPDPTQPGSAEAEAMLAAVREAAPHVSSAGEALRQAGSALDAGEFARAHAAQRAAQASLGEARERFFDLRQLVEAAYADEQRIRGVATASQLPSEASESTAEIATLRNEYAPALRALQDANLERGDRIDAKVADEMRALDDQAAAAAEQAAGAAAAPQENAPDPEQLAAEAERMKIASALTTQALASMDRVRAALGDEATAVDWPEVGSAAERATDHLESLRLLFFSIVEHVRELGRKQLDLADETEDAVALAVTDTGRAQAAPSAAAAASAAEADPGTATAAGDAAGAATAAGDAAPAAASQATSTPEPPRSDATLQRIAPLAAEQGSLAERAGQIGDALAAQADRAAAQPEAGGAEDDDAPERLRRAAEHVVTAQLAMRDALGILEDRAAPLAPSRNHQDAALAEIEKALALLEPPQPPQEQEQQQQQEDPQQGDEDAEPEPSENEQDADPQQLLQGVRDREAERQREAERNRSAARSEPVQKDW